MEKLFVVSNAFDANELYQYFSSLDETSTDVKIEMVEESEKSLSLDPTVLTALITLSVSSLNYLISGLFNIWQKNKDNRNKESTAIVKIKAGKDNIELEFPFGISEEDREKLIKEALSLQSIKQIALIEK